MNAWALICAAWLTACTIALYGLWRTAGHRYVALLYLGELLRWFAIATAATTLLLLGRT